MLYHFSNRKYEATKNAPGHLDPEHIAIMLSAGSACNRRAACGGCGGRRRSRLGGRRFRRLSRGGFGGHFGRRGQLSGNIRAVHMPGALADGDAGVHCNIWLNRGVIYAESAFLT